MGVKSTIDRQFRQSLFELVNSGVGDLSISEAQEPELGQPLQMDQPGVGDLGAREGEEAERLVSTPRWAIPASVIPLPLM